MLIALLVLTGASFMTPAQAIEFPTDTATKRHLPSGDGDSEACLCEALSCTAAGQGLVSIGANPLLRPQSRGRFKHPLVIALRGLAMGVPLPPPKIA